MRFAVACLVCVGCRSSTPSSFGDAPPDFHDAAPGDTAGGGGYQPTESHALGIDDVSMLLQLPEDPVYGTTLARLSGFTGGGDLVSRDLFDQFITTPGDIGYAFDDFHLVAIRFDLCDRMSQALCHDGQDGQIRLVFQPVTVANAANAPSAGIDVGLHATYPVPSTELAPMINELRALARLRAFQTASPLAIDDKIASTSPPSEYSKRLSALLAKYASAATLQRLSVLAIARDATNANLHWVARSLVRVGATFEPFMIPTVGASAQDLREVDPPWPPTFATTPAAADSPPGIALAFDSTAFESAAYLDRQTALQALARAQNPQLTAFGTEQCMNCHGTAMLTRERANTQGVDPTTVLDTYGSARNISITQGVGATTEATIRAFGWFMQYPLFSQRVANESANVLDEIDARFPPAATTTLPDAGMIDAPPGVKRVFVTRGLYPADLANAGAGSDGLTGADKLCAAAAAHGNLGGQWTAWISTSTVDAIDRIIGDGPWYLVDGTTLVFATKAAIGSGPQAAIDRDETNAQPPGAENAWTGTAANGRVVAGAACTDWSASTYNTAGMSGLRVMTDASWTDYMGADCSATGHLYCFER